MRPRAAEFEQAGAKLAVIGNGWPAMAKAFAEHVRFPDSVAVLTLFNPAALARFVRATLKGFRQGRTAGDPWQLGGSLVVRPGGKVAFRHVSWGPGDHASADALLAAVKTTP